MSLDKADHFLLRSAEPSVHGRWCLNPDVCWRRFGDQGVVFNAATGDTVLVAASAIEVLEQVKQAQEENGAVDGLASDPHVVGADAPAVSVVSPAFTVSGGDDDLMDALMANDFIRCAERCD